MTRCGVLIAVALVAAACASGPGGPAGVSERTTVPPTNDTATTNIDTTVPATPNDTTPNDTVPNDTVPNDTGVFTDAAALAKELSTVEAGIRSSDATAADLAAMGVRQQLAYRAVNRHPEWDAAVLAAIDPVARVPLGFHIAARQAQAAHAAGHPPAPLPDTLPAWTIVAPLPVDELRGYYDEAQAATGVPWEYLAAIHFQETRMGRIVGASSAGAVGPMQFLPSTWAKCCTGDPTVARDAILGAARYLVQLGAPKDMQKALFGYNPNSGYVGAVTAFAQNMIADPRAYLGYHGWTVLYGTTSGTIRLPVGYGETAPIDVATYLQDHPDALVPAG